MCFLRRMGLEAFRSHACSLVPTRGESSSASGASPVIDGARSSQACAQGYATVKVHARHRHNETSCGHGERSCCEHPVPTMCRHDVLELRTRSASEAQNAWRMSRRTHGGQVSACVHVCVQRATCTRRICVWTKARGARGVHASMQAEGRYATGTGVPRALCWHL